MSSAVHGSPSRVVAFGGGTGLPAVLRGLRGLVLSGELKELTAVVTMTDDGGSSGRLRRTRGVPPPGDLRNCLVALAREENVMARLFQHRYCGSEELGGHTVGNLVLAALAEQTGSFLEAVELSSRVLHVAGRILPSTLDTVSLEATMQDGSVVSGETAMAASAKHIHHVALHPAPAAPTPGVLGAVSRADIVVLGPGSLYTSVVPNLLVDGIAEALRETEATVVFVANIVSEPGETDELDLEDQLGVVEAHAGGRFVDAVVVHEGAVNDAVLARYESEGARLLRWPSASASPRRVIRRDLVARGDKLRHDPDATAAALIAARTEALTERVPQAAALRRHR